MTGEVGTTSLPVFFCFLLVLVIRVAGGHESAMIGKSRGRSEVRRIGTYRESLRDIEVCVSRSRTTLADANEARD